MLRPATPLSILLFIAFVLLLLSVISTPIVKGIPLATFDGIDFGVFGYCKGNECHGPQIGYPTGMLIVLERSERMAGGGSSPTSCILEHSLKHATPLVCITDSVR